MAQEKLKSTPIASELLVWLNGLVADISRKAEINHTHGDEYAAKSHTHSEYAAAVHTHSASDISLGIISVANGGTGAGDATAALSNLGGVPTSDVANSANKIPRYNSNGHLVLPSGAEFWIE